jgi:hypothetical protein
MRSCFAALLWLVAAGWLAAPAVTCDTAAAPSPVSTALVNVRRFTEPATENVAVAGAPLIGRRGNGREICEPLFAYCENRLRSSYTNGAAGCQARRSVPWEER